MEMHCCLCQRSLLILWDMATKFPHVLNWTNFSPISFGQPFKMMMMRIG